MFCFKRRRSYVLSSESSNWECSIPVYQRKKIKRITVGQSNLKKFCDRSIDADDNSGPKFVNIKENSVVRTAIKDESAKFKSRNNENTCHANVKSVIGNKGEYNEHVRNFRWKYNLNEDPCDSHASSDDKLSNGKEYSDRKNKVEVMGNSQKIGNGTSANKHNAWNSIVTSTPLKQNQKENKKNREAVANMRHHIMKMGEKLKYILSKFQLKVHRFQLRYLQDEIVTEQDGKDIMYIYNSMINKFKKELTVQQRISMGPYHQRGMNYNCALRFRFVT